MGPPINTHRSGSSGSSARSMLGIGAVMLLACLAGPALAGAIAGVLAGAGGAVFALAFCAAVPVVVVALRRRSARRTAALEL